MQSLLGLLVFACRVMPMGRVFSRRLSLATKGARHPEHRIRISAQLRAYLRVWESFLVTYNGRTCWQASEVTNSEISLFTDAVGAHGFGAIFGSSWCADSWPHEWSASGLVKNLTLLELFPIVVSVELWGNLLANKRICFWTDNLGVVFAVNKLTSSSLPVLALLRHLVLRCLEWNIMFRAQHVPGVDNVIADPLSRLDFQVFRQRFPGAELEGCRCPPHMWNLIHV
ncbi:hypothetical protein GDO81_010876 [Engystomops pustulosus]|uniref:Uncharacterized protein n=1 Tax=Engystomops pustulosus TaxID=76066 RepID=A0AAV7C4I3_ENGPU|nr:hypothetical protein GDO81_010876 [Engystomops pustulosus]